MSLSLAFQKMYLLHLRSWAEGRSTARWDGFNSVPLENSNEQVLADAWEVTL